MDDRNRTNWTPIIVIVVAGVATVFAVRAWYRQREAMRLATLREQVAQGLRPNATQQERELAQAASVLLANTVGTPENARAKYDAAMTAAAQAAAASATAAQRP